MDMKNHKIIQSFQRHSGKQKKDLTRFIALNEHTLEIFVAGITIISLDNT